MSKIKVVCPERATQYGVDESHVGKRAHCKKCNARFVMTHFEEMGQSETEPAGVSASETDVPREWTNHDGSRLLLVPGGKFLAGIDKFEVELPAYYLGITRVTNAQYKRFVDATSHRPPDRSDCGASHFGAPIWQGKNFPSEKAG
ncbi:MAG: hypothetical protein ACOC7K_00385 [bacterium]